jgi:hypothetical protein
LPTASAATPSPADDPFTQVEYGGFETIDRPAPGQVRAAYLGSGPDRQAVFVIGHADRTVTVADAETRTAVTAGDRAIVATRVGWCPVTRTLQEPLSGMQWDEHGLSYDAGSIGTHAVRDSIRSPGRIDVTHGSAEGGVERADGERPAPCAASALLRHDETAYATATAAEATLAPDYRRVDGYLDIGIDRVVLCSALTGRRCATGIPADTDTVFAYDTVEAYVLRGTFLVRAAERGHVTVVRLPAVRVVSRIGAGARHAIGFVRRVTPRADGTADVAFDSTRYYDGSVGEEGADTGSRPPPVPPAYDGLVTNDRAGLVTYRTVRDAVVYRDDGTKTALSGWRDDGALYWLVLDDANAVLRLVQQTSR